MSGDPTPSGAPDQSAASLAAKLRAEIRAEIGAGLAARPAVVRDLVPPHPVVAAASLVTVPAATTARTGTIPAADGRPDIPLPVSAATADLSLPSTLNAGLTFTYRISDRPKTWNDDDKTATGYINAHVNFAAGKLVTIDVRGYYIAEGEDAPAVTSGNRAAVGDEVSAGVHWINPKLLALLLDDSQRALQAGIRVKRINFFEAEDAEGIEGVRFEWGTQWTTYKLGTGLLLSVLRGKTDPNETKEITYISRRTLSIPWAQAQPPDWVRHTRGLTYQGSNTIVLPTSLTMQMVTLTADLETLHSDVLLAKVASHIDNGPLVPPEDSNWEMVCASTMLYPLWISPSAVREMHPGRIIDEDPVTHFTITFGGIEALHAAVVEEGPLEQTTYYFDPNSGMLAGFRGQRPSPDGDGEVQTQMWLVAQL